MDNKKVSCSRGTRPNIDFCTSLVGMEREEAIKAIESNHWRARITRVEGKSFIITMDHRLDRVNLQLEKSIVVSANVG